MATAAAHLDDWRDRLVRLCAQRAELVEIRTTMETGIASLNEEIKAILTAHDQTSVEVPGYKVTLVTTTRPTLSTERLLELGVDTATLAQATKTTVSTSVRVTAAGA